MSQNIREVLLRYCSLRSVLSASGATGKDGLHESHAYSILQVKKVRRSSAPHPKNMMKFRSQKYSPNRNDYITVFIVLN
eukprot:1283825-Amphidinium_carterae.1